jgi:short-subunit dehydrogenase
MKIANSVAIVTGASGGIGSAVCFSLGSRKAKVNAVGRNGETLEKLKSDLAAKGIEITTHAVDVRQKDQVAAMVASIESGQGGIDILVNNAAVGLFQSIADCSEYDIDQVWSTNVIGPINCIQEVIPNMRKRRRGHIVNVSSIIGEHSVYNQGIYAASKAALDRISESLSAEEKKNGIKVTVVVPDRTATDFVKHVVGPKEKAVLPGGSMRQLTPQQVAEGLVQAVENDQVRHYSSLKGKIFSLLSVLAPGTIRHILRPQDE